MTPRLLALVPMRHHSVRVPGKNYRRLGGQPLYAHILRTLVACPEIDGIVVDTDSREVRASLARDFPGVDILDRPPALCGDEVPMNRILVHDAQTRPAQFYLQTHSTNPLLRPATVSRAIADFLDHVPGHDALFSVTRWQKRLWDASGKPLNHDPAVLLPTQSLAPIYEENSCLYLFERQAFLAMGNRLCRSPRFFEIEAAEAWDIDTEADFAIAEALMEIVR